ncbi:MAG TPA: TAXI family TRAP transporter solute-binding subunit [Burkholderiaceae bacterium]|nr:TAXI family TRAP transporter solute-binding subunit [Burkholderiaceae bacterium]
MLRLVVVTLFSLLLAACGRQPGEALVRSNVEQVLNQTFGDGIFEVVEFARRGTATDSTAPDDERRRVVYYDVELELQRDLVLGDWADPGAASLVTALGAGPLSVRGVKAGGNVAGDRIVAHASAIYRKEADSWEFVMPAGIQEPGRPRVQAGPAPNSAQAALDRLAEITRSVEAGGSPTAQRVVDRELQRSLARISGRLTRIEQGYPLAAGAERGEYAAFANAWAAIAAGEQLKIAPVATGGSEENLELLRSGSVILALAQADTAHAALSSTGPFQGQGGFGNLRALGSLYPEYVHIVVRQSAVMQSAFDLKGARIALGPEGSAVRATLQRVLAAHGLEAGRDYEPVELRLNEALPALISGDIDAAAHVIGLPAAPLRNMLAEGEQGIKLLPLADEAVERLSQAHDGMVAARIAAHVYPGQRIPVATVAVPALLVTTEELSPDEAARLVQSVYQHGNDLLARGSAQGSQVSVRTARMGLTIPLHPGAEQALAELASGVPRP